jgi:hypothetical protein
MVRMTTIVPHHEHSYAVTHDAIEEVIRKAFKVDPPEVGSENCWSGALTILIR